MQNNTPRRKMGILVALLVLVFLSFSIYLASFAQAAPQGATISDNSTAGTPSFTAGNRTDARGTITTMVLDTVQQDQSWKGYVGNVTGKFSLDDADSFTLYDWDFVGVTLAGEVFASRASSVSWPNITCANAGNISAEETFHNMSGADVDSISSTFNYTIHDTFQVGSASGTTTITNSTCSSTATYVNDTRQTMTNESEIYFQEILLQDTSDNIVFVTIIEDNYDSYRTEANSTHDFQMILPESDVKSSATTYYFFLELS